MQGSDGKRCIFCGGGKLSKEHFYPQWMHSLLPVQTRYGELTTSHHPVRGEAVERHVERPAAMATRKIRVVCRACNNGWMNRLEAAARPHLTRMILGKRFQLQPEEQLAVAQWCAAKVMVAEQGPSSDPMTPPADRLLMAQAQTIPDYYRIFLGAHSCEAQTGYVRRSSTISLTTAGPNPPLDGMRRNVQQVSFLMGKAFVHIDAARVEGFKIEDLVNMPIVHKYMRVWPPTGTRRKWPGAPVLTFDQVKTLSSSWEAIATSTPALWGGEIDPSWI